MNTFFGVILDIQIHEKIHPEGTNQVDWRMVNERDYQDLKFSVPIKDYEKIE